jgi:Zn-dependent alcohol dehydrogenase
VIAAGQSHDAGLLGAAVMSAGTPAAAQHEPELAGQTVVVIGGSAGIGLETARRARAEGAEVILTGRDPFVRLSPSREPRCS